MIGDRYELDRQIGQGGTAAVWLGHDTVLGRRVALKRLGYSPEIDGTDAARAEREAHLTARVHHPNVVAVYDVADDEDDRTWLVLEHVDGPTLAQLCETSPLEPRRAAHLLAQVADGLAAAHALGIVHRDVKPSNVLVTHDDVAKLGDFGIARRENDEALTRTGLITGSPAYLSPEVARGQTATTASDVWALGATLYHVCAGRPPYAIGDDLIAAVQTIIDDTAPTLPTSHPLAPVVAAAMHRDPERRPSMADVAAALHELAPSVLDAAAAQAVDPTGLDDAAVDEPTVAADDVAADGEPTRTFTLAGTGAPASRSTGTSSVPPPSLPPPSGRRHRSPRRGALVAAAVAASLMAVVGTAVVVGGDDPAGPSAATGDSTSADGPVSASTLEAFAADYLSTANTDPRQGFSMLTPSYQAASGGLSGYEGFWGNVSDVEVQRISADADRLRVTYIYTYTYDGAPRTETVTLYLERDGDRFLISGADSI